MNTLEEKRAAYFNERQIDISDYDKWAYKGIPQESWGQGNSPFDLIDSTVPVEERRKISDAWAATRPDREFVCAYKCYDNVSGCPEEPDAPPVKVHVYTPNKVRSRMKTLFYIYGGAQSITNVWESDGDMLAEQFGCVVVVTEFRRAFDAPYPGAINDLHAGYQWINENAEMLHIDTAKIVLTGGSSGAQLAMSLPFRLKRYGFKVRGVAAYGTWSDDREMYSSSRFFNGDSDGYMVRLGYETIMGRNLGTIRVGPEAWANHATVEECKGYPPVYLLVGELDTDRDYALDFAHKLYEAHVFCDIHVIAGHNHFATGMMARRNPESLLYKAFNQAISDLFEYDQTRSWMEE
jgi:acetyl esterase/lipase